MAWIKPSFSTTWSATNLRIRNVSTFKCLLCHPIKGFVYKHTYDDHMNIHNQEKPYKCDQCEGVAYANSANLNAHIRATHKGIKRKPKAKKQKRDD